MTRIKAIDKISKDYVTAIRNEWNGDLGFKPAAIVHMSRERFDHVDVVETVEDGTPVDVSKESAHETHIVLTHRTVAGVSLRVTVSYNPHLGLCVTEVSAH